MGAVSLLVEEKSPSRRWAGYGGDSVFTLVMIAPVDEMLAILDAFHE